MRAEWSVARISLLLAGKEYDLRDAVLDEG
jgi:hypothetical protein